MDWRKESQKTALLISAAAVAQFPDHSRAEIAFAGRSNVGKSSLINALLGRRQLARVSRQPGRTRTLNFYPVGERLCLVDLPGYGFARVSQKERERWGRLIETYLRERAQLAGVIQVVDIRHAPSELDRMMAEWLREPGLPAVIVATKADKISRGNWKGQADKLARTLDLPVLVFSARTGYGREQVIAWIDAVVDNVGR